MSLPYGLSQPKAFSKFQNSPISPPLLAYLFSPITAYSFACLFCPLTVDAFALDSAPHAVISVMHGGTSGTVSGCSLLCHSHHPFLYNRKWEWNWRYCWRCRGRGRAFDIEGWERTNIISGMTNDEWWSLDYVCMFFKGLNHRYLCSHCSFCHFDYYDLNHGLFCSLQFTLLATNELFEFKMLCENIFYAILVIDHESYNS